MEAGDEVDPRLAYMMPLVLEVGRPLVKQSLPAAETPVLSAAEEMEEEMDEKATLPVTEIAGVGPATAEKMEKLEIETVGDLANADAAALAEAVGKTEEAATEWIQAARDLAQITPDEESETEETEGVQVPADSEE